MTGFSLSRIVAVMIKEMIQMRRDRLTFAMIIAIPVLQLVLFGYAINTDPRRLPTAVVAADTGPLARSILAGMRASEYFDVIGDPVDEAEAARLIRRGDVAYVLTIPTGFSRDVGRGETPAILIQADATDPAATSGGVNAMSRLVERAVARDVGGAATEQTQPAVEVIVHRLYNPEGITAFNIVPGLLGTILTMTTILMTGLALTREVERGTMENLMAMPARPHEIMIGKIVPYIGLGFLQVAVILAAAAVLFRVPMEGPLLTLLGVTLIFIAANVTLGYTFSTVAHSQMQAMQMTFFFFLPSILLSGFMFPFRGMPVWAQWIGEAIPLTHFLRAVRAIMLKGGGLFDVTQHLWPLLAFWAAVATLALLRYRRTLD